MEKYTDQEFFYKQTPVNYDGIAKFTSIKGNTLGWNQLIQNGNFANSSSWVGQSATVSISNGVANVTLSVKGNYVALRQNYTGISKTGHKYFVTATIKSAKKTAVGFYLDGQYAFQDGYDIQANTLTIVSSLIDGGSSGGFNIYVSRKNELEIGDVVQVSNVMLIDLTQMYGSGNEPTADEFVSLFSLPYYDFNQGTLIPFSGNGIKTTGKNLLNLNIADGTYLGLTVKKEDDGSVSINGRATSSGNIYLMDNTGNNFYVPNDAILSTNVVSHGEYDVKLTTLENTSVVTIGNESLSANVPKGWYKGLRLYLANGRDYNLNLKLMIAFDSTDYEPYTETITDLPISTYFPTGMKRAGNVYDELTPTKAITRIGAVDLGTLTYTRVTNKRYQTTGLANLCKWYSQGIRQLNLLCSKFITDTSTNAGTVYGGDEASKTIYFWTNEDEYQSADAFKSAMSGVYLYYELATETETDAEDIFYKFYADGTEQLLPVNGSSPVTSYLTADIEYYDSTEGDSLYRRFWLINGDGERWDLTDKEFKSFLNNPTGLGFRKTIEIARYGEKANKNNEVYDFPQPSGELLFYDTYNSTRYDKYNKFIRFLMSQPITLYYMIPVSYISGIANIFTLDCDVTEVQKTESKTDHILTSSIVFNGLGFYEGDEISVNGTTDTYTLTNEGDFPVGFEITVEGSLTKPYITLSQDGELYGEARFDSETAFNSLYLNSNDGEQNIILQQGGSVIPNPLSYQDLSISNGSIYVTFVKLAKGVSELSIGVESGSITNVNIKYSPKYRSV